MWKNLIRLVIIFLLSNRNISSFSQGLYNSGVAITIYTNTNVVISGDLFNDGVITNSGQLFINGNWNNQGIFEESEGRVILNGENIQRINHNNQNFYSLQIEGGNKIIESCMKLAEKSIIRNI